MIRTVNAGKRKSGGQGDRPKYDRSVFRVIILAGALLVFTTTLIGILSYRITEQEVIRKLKNNDLARTAKSIASQVEGRIDRAVETSLMLAGDPAVVEWVSGGETDDKLGKIVLGQLMDLPKNFDYTNSFVVSAVTRQYWAENGKVLERIERDDPDDQWFFQTIASGKRTDVVVDTNKSRKDTFVFSNVLIGDLDNPVGVAGIGMSLKALSEEFATFKYGSNSHLWMIGNDGTIHLADSFELTGENIADQLPASALAQLAQVDAGQQVILETEDREGRKIDMISYPIQAANMRLLAQIPRSETVGFLDTIRLNTAIAVTVSIVVVVFFFLYISRRLADPYKRALAINEELERKVEIRTKELAERNKEMTDSIAYANRIQQSVLPQEEEMRSCFAGHFAIWKPRDGVGGDFYWMKRVEGVYWIAVGDCTGHGVPGALMTMLSVSLLDRIAASGGHHSPAEVLGKLNVLLKETLKQVDQDGLTDDGLDLGICFLREDEVVYAGAGITLVVGEGQETRHIKGDKLKIGYRRTPLDVCYTDHRFDPDPERIYYMLTDGIADQNGGDGRISLGRKKLLEWLTSWQSLPLAEQGDRLEKALTVFMGEQPQRDDMTVLAFKYERWKLG